MGYRVQYKCPVCGLPLVPQLRNFHCEKNHSFDQARSGYVNLLLAQHKQSRQPGDADEMVLARQRFLDHGYYLALAQGLEQILIQILQKRSTNEDFQLLDLGCGEGYYLQQLSQLLSKTGLSLQLAGIDISKKAIHEHAKR